MMSRQVTRYALSVGMALLLSGCGCDCPGEKMAKNQKSMSGGCGCSCESAYEEAPVREVQTSEHAPVGTDMVTTKSGLQYSVLVPAPADAKSPKQGKQVLVHYTGWLEQNGELGAKFDSSVDRGEPFAFIVGVGYVIPGWDEGVMGMKVGEKRRLVIPAQLGYGSRGAPPRIPGGATLVFDVELLDAA